MKGLYLPEKEAYEIVSFQKKEVALPLEVQVGEKYYLLSKDKVYGEVSLANTAITGVFKVDSISPIKPSLTWKRTEKPTPIVDDVEIDKSVFIKFPVTKVKRDFIDGLAETEKVIIKKKIDQLRSIFPEDEELKEADIKLFSKIKMDDDRKFTLQVRFQNLRKEDLDFPYEALLIKFPKTTFDLRLSILDNELHTWSIEPQGENTLKYSTAEFIEGASNVWLDIAKKDSYEVGTKEGYLKVFNIDYGSMKYKIINKNIYEIDLNGAVLNGKYIISRRGENPIWKFEKLENQEVL